MDFGPRNYNNLGRSIKTGKFYGPHISNDVVFFSLVDLVGPYQLGGGGRV